MAIRPFMLSHFFQALRPSKAVDNSGIVRGINTKMKDQMQEEPISIWCGSVTPKEVRWVF